MCFLLQHSQCKKISICIIYVQCLRLSLVLIHQCRLYCFVTVCRNGTERKGKYKRTDALQWILQQLHHKTVLSFAVNSSTKHINFCFLIKRGCNKLMFKYFKMCDIKKHSTFDLLLGNNMIWCSALWHNLCKIPCNTSPRRVSKKPF